MTEQEQPKPETGGSTSPGPAAGGGKSPIDPRKVMEDALSAIVNRADNVAGIPPSEGPVDGREAGPGVRKKRKRIRKRRGGGPEDGAPDGADRKQRKRTGGAAPAHARDAVDSLSLMARKLLDSKKVHFLRRPRYMELSIKVPLDVQFDGGRCASQLVEQVLERIEEVQRREDAWAPNSVYCYFSESSGAEGCRPTEPRQVFDGYGSTGRPKFTDFVTMAIERKAKGIEALVGGEEVTLTHVTQGRVLRTAQLAEFGKASPLFRILGQVDAGLFAVRGQESKAAFSFQVLLGKGLEGQPTLRLHPVGHCDVMNLLDHSVPQILLRFQGDLDEAALRLKGLQANGDAPDEEEFVLPMLQDLAKRLEDRAKHRSRRTEHADRRSAASTRPTTKAYDDAQQVADEDLLWDDTEGTVVVVGRQNRVHVFTPEGRHVTSLANMHKGAVQQRVKSNRWRRTEPEERGEFRMQIRQMVRSHREEEERTAIAKKERREQRESKAPAPAGGGHLQSQIAQLMSGIGGAATPPAEPAPPKAPPEPADPPPEVAEPAPEAADPAPEAAAPAPEAAEPVKEIPTAGAPEVSVDAPRNEGAQGEAP